MNKLSSAIADEVIAVVVMYRPAANHRAHVKALLDSGQRLIVVDNSENPDNETSSLLSSGSNSVLLHNGNRGGIAGALNRAFEYASGIGNPYVILLDQDSEVSVDILGNLAQAHARQSELGYARCIIGPNFFDRGSKTYGRCARLTKYSFASISVSSPGGQGLVHETSFLITSGSCMRAADWKKIGPFNESLFIDHVDTEYCLRAMTCGYQLFLAEDIVIQHAVGERTVHRLLGLTFKPSFHSPFRRYFIFRNGLNVMFRFGPKFPGFIVLNMARMIHDFAGILFFEDQRPAKLKAVFRGVADALRGRLGAYPY